MSPERPASLPDDDLIPPEVGRQRVLVGLVQGLLLSVLYRAAQDHGWPATVPPLFVALVLAGVLSPVLLVSCLGHLPRRALLVWVVGAATIAAALGAYDGWRQLIEPLGEHARATPAPSAPLTLAAMAGFFIAHALILTGYAERRRIASYYGYFETAWKLGVQLGFSVLFVGATWLVLTLGAQLFLLVKLTLFKEVISQSWFAIPATVFAFTAAMHITDVRPGIVRGIRSLLLTLMGWILPIATLIVAAFLLSLPFTGLAPLWATRSASALMLTGAALLVVLINAAWQDGGALPDAAAPIRLASRLACVLLLPLFALAGYALYLRVAEHGWTHDRIVAAACLVVAGSYAAGYLRAACLNAQLDAVAHVNIGTALLVLVVLLALFSPLANPQRIAVASQLARLETGKVSAEKFDYAYLRFEGGRYGRDALNTLKTATGKDAVVIQRGAAKALAMTFRGQSGPPEVVADLDIAANITVWPSTAQLPADFTKRAIQKPVSSRALPACLTMAKRHCDAFLLDLTGDARREILLIAQHDDEPAHVMGQDDAGQWRLVGVLPDSVGRCAGLVAALKAGNVRAVAPAGKAVDIGGRTLQVNYDVDYADNRCQDVVPAKTP